MSAFFSGVTKEQLAAVDLFEGLDDKGLDEVKACSYFLGAHPGLHVVRADDVGFELYIILAGTADVIQDGKTIATLGKGDVFGEMAVLGNIHRNADVVATSVMSMISMRGNDFRRLVADYPEVERRLRNLAEERMS
jgi:CPA1 family monovalent cation:H+ antiporter